MFALPSRSVAASSRICCSVPRWIENCGHLYPASTPRGSLQIGLPCLEKYASSLVRTAAASRASCRPSSISSRTACGSTLMPTPSGFSSETLSNTLAGTPIWCRLSASVSPPMPPPAMSTVMLRPCYALLLHGRHDRGGGSGQLRRRGGDPPRPGHSRERGGRAEESDDPDQPAVGTDLAKIDRGVAAGPVRAHQPPEEADHVVM